MSSRTVSRHGVLGRLLSVAWLVRVVALLGLVCAFVVQPVIPASMTFADTGTCFSSPNAQSLGTYTVPSGVTTVRIAVAGDPGQHWVGYNWDSPNPTQVADIQGGLGSEITIELSVTPGEVLQRGELPGAPGGYSYNNHDYSVPGNGGPYGGISEPGGHGGVARYVTTTDAGGCAHLVALAAGGGGGGGGISGGAGGNADTGTGATAGGDGADNSAVDGSGGGPGTASSGGYAGSHGHSALACHDGSDGTPGGFLSGGNGATAAADVVDPGGDVFCAGGEGAGGGGAGYYYGGGGGSGYNSSPSGGGGGGSSYLAPGTTLISEFTVDAVTGLYYTSQPIIEPVYTTTTTISASPNPSVRGQLVTITAHVTSNAPNPSVVGGTVDFVAGVTTIGTGTVSNGVATFSTSSLPQGSNFLQAFFEGYDTLTAQYSNPVFEVDRSSWTQSQDVGGTLVPYTQVVNPPAVQVLPPTVTANPTDDMATYGSHCITGASCTDSAGFTAVATGSPLPTVQWQKSTDGGTTWTNATGDGATFVETDIIPGSAFASYGLNPSVSQSGEKYRAVFSTAGGTATTSAATLTISPAALTIIANDKAMFYGSPMPTLNATYGDPTDGAVLRNGDTPNSLSGTLSCAVPGGTPTAPATYPIVCTGQSSPNYTITYRSGTLTIVKAPQTIHFTSSTNAVVGGTYTPTATAGGSLPVTFSIDPVSASVCSISAAGVVTFNSVDANLGVANCDIDADQAGNVDYQAAAQVMQQVTVHNAPPTITAQPTDQTVTDGDSVTLSAQATGSNLNTLWYLSTDAGHTWTPLSNDNPYRFTAQTSMNGYEYKVQFWNVAVYPLSTNSVTSNIVTLTVNPRKSTQTLSFTLPKDFSKTYGDAAFGVGSYASAGSGLPVSFSSTTLTVCTVSSSTVTMVAAGTCTITADQTGDDNYNPAPQVQQSFIVGKATLTITPMHDPVSYGDPAPTDGWGYTPSGFVNSDIAGSTTITGSPTGCGSAYVQGNPSGSSYAISCTGTDGMLADNYTFSLATGSLTVGTRAITVTASDAGYTYGDTPSSSDGATVTAGNLAGSDTLAGLGVACSPVDSSTTPFTPSAATAAGHYSIVCSRGNTTDYSYTYLSGTLTVHRAPLTITASSPSMVYGTSVPAVMPNYSGLKNKDSAPATPPTCSTTATHTSSVGGYDTSCSGASDTDYSIGYIPGTLTITQAASTVSVMSSVNPSVYGQAVTFTATVTRNGSGDGTPTGSVTFTDGNNSLGTGTLSVVNGADVATLTIPASSPLAVASHSITAVYGSDVNFTGSTSSTLTQKVNEAATTVSLTSSLNPSILNGNVTFTATVASVAPGTGVPGGTVTFKDGITALGTAPLNSSGVATLTTSSLPVGARSITASYGGSPSYTSSVNRALTQNVQYKVNVLSTSALSIALQLWDANNVNVSASTLQVTAECVVPYTTTPATSCGTSSVQSIKSGTFGFNKSWRTYGPSYLYGLSPKGLTKGTQYDLLVQTAGDPSWHTVPFTY